MKKIAILIIVCSFIALLPGVVFPLTGVFSPSRFLPLVTLNYSGVPATDDSLPRFDRSRFRPSFATRQHKGAIEEDRPLTIPTFVTDKVRAYIDQFTGADREVYQTWLTRMARIEPQVREVFIKEGLPPDLIYVAMIESGFEPRVTSRMRAKGMWQLMAGTARAYGITVNGRIDERRDSIRSTVAAARYFKKLYEMFGSWDLAIAAYNAGEIRIYDAIRRYHTTDFWELQKHPVIHRETKIFVPKVIAAMIVGANYASYGFTKNDAPEHRSVVADADSKPPEPLAADVAGMQPARSRPSKGDEPSSPDPVVATSSPPNRPSAKDAPSVSGESARKIASTDEPFFTHRVKKGETLISIAKRYGVSTRSIAAGNGIHGTMIVIGRRLVIGRRHAATALSPRIYAIRRGDTLTAIARREGMSVKKILLLNDMDDDATIVPGRKLIVGYEKKVDKSSKMREKTALNLDVSKARQ